MLNDPETSSTTPSAIQQRKQAGILLLRLQWLFILLLVIALIGMYISQQRFQNKVNERLQSNEQVVTRLNEMDDRLFAISQQTVPQPSAIVGSQAQNQLDLLRIQIQAVDRLLADNDGRSAIELLRGLQWQLSQKGNEIAPALTVVIKQNLDKDIERLQAQSAQPSPWQLQNLAIQNIQEFLHSYERVNSEKQTSATSKKSELTARQLSIHEVIMTLNLAIQASNMREQDQLVSYLRQARNQLQLLTSNNTKDKLKTDTDSSKKDKSKIIPKVEKQPKVNEIVEIPQNISEVVTWLDKLIANAPKPTPLATTQILNQSKN